MPLYGDSKAKEEIHTLDQASLLPYTPSQYSQVHLFSNLKNILDPLLILKEE